MRLSHIASKTQKTEGKETEAVVGSSNVKLFMLAHLMIMRAMPKETPMQTERTTTAAAARCSLLAAASTELTTTRSLGSCETANAAEKIH